MNKALRILLASPVVESSALASALAASDCLVTRVSSLSEAADGAAWHEALVVVHADDAAIADLRATLDGRGERIPVVAVLVGPDAQADPPAATPDLIQHIRWAAIAHRERARRRSAQAALKFQRELFDGFMSHSPAVAYLKDARGRYAWVNAAFAQHFHLEGDSWRDKTDADLWGEEAGRQLAENDRAVLAHGQALEVIETVPHDDGPHDWFAFKFPWRDAEGRPVVGGMAVDVTPLRRAEEARQQASAIMEQARRLEGLGALASSIAHDFNNLLVAVLGNASLAAMDVPAGSTASRFLEQVEQSALRGAELSHQLLLLSGRASLMLEVADLAAFVRERQFTSRARLPAGVRLHVEAGDDGPRIQTDAAQLEEILLALVGRAGSAPCTTVTLRVAVEDVSADELGSLLLGEFLHPGQHAVLEVRDDGPELSPQQLARLFEPDYAIRQRARPSGLPAALGLVRGHGGALGVTSDESGTCVRVLFPLAPRLAAAEEPTEDLAATGGTVLVVDDEEAVRSIAHAALQRFGWKTLTARDGHEALEIFKTMRESVSAVLLDSTMPGLSGAQVLERLKELRPDVKVVLTSGYEKPGMVGAGAAAAFLPKPYRPARLLRTLKSVVGDGGQAPIAPERQAAPPAANSASTDDER